MKPGIRAVDEKSVAASVEHPAQHAVEVRAASLGLEDLYCDRGWNDVAQGVLVRHDRSDRPLVSEQRGVPEALALTEQVEDDLLDPQLHRTAPDHEHRVRWVGIAMKDRHAFGEMRFLDRASHGLKQVVGEPGERRIALEETRDVDDASMRACRGVGEPKPLHDS
jgi:hypothetical protein